MAPQSTEAWVSQRDACRAGVGPELSLSDQDELASGVISGGLGTSPLALGSQSLYPCLYPCRF
jgi:hypothetical protein